MLRIAIVAFSLCSVVAFTAEPSTSTVFDVREGRGVAVVHGGSSERAVSAIVELARAARAVVSAIVTLAGAAFAVRWFAIAGREADVPPSQRLLCWDAVERRGPPAPV